MRIIWSGPARRDLLRIAAFYRRIDPDLSAAMRLRIEAGVQRIVELRSLGQIGPGGIRKWRIPGTAFIIQFVITPTRLEIRSVHHAREDRPASP